MNHDLFSASTQIRTNWAKYSVKQICFLFDASENSLTKFNWKILELKFGPELIKINTKRLKVDRSMVKICLVVFHCKFLAKVESFK